MSKKTEYAVNSAFKPLTAEQLSVPPQFVQYHGTRQVQNKISAEVNGKYYLDQKALQEMRKQMANRASKQQ